MLDFLFKSNTREQGKFNLPYQMWDEMYINDSVLFIDLLKADRALKFDMTIDIVIYFIKKAKKHKKYNKCLIVDTWEAISSNFMVDLVKRIITDDIFQPNEIIVMPVLFPRQRLIDEFKSLGVELWHSNYFFPREYYLNKNHIKISNPEKKFLCLNNQDTIPRRYIISQLFENNITDGISWGGANETRFKEGKFYRWNIQRSAKDMGECCSINDVDLLNKYRNWFFTSHKVDGDIYHPNDMDLTLSSPIWNASINLITETRTPPHYVDEPTVTTVKYHKDLRDVFSTDYLFVTEKTLKGIMAGQIFCVFSSVGVLQYLHDLGFKTFGDHIDESYDTEKNWTLRAQKIVSNIKYLLEMPDDKWRKLHNDIQPIIEYNQKHMTEFVKSGKFMFKLY